VLAKAPRDTDDTLPEGRDFPVADPESDVPIPSPTPSDPEDVSWALSTAEAMWARGDIAEAVKWLRRGAEAASEAEADERALELAKAAANLSARLPRRSSPSAPPQGSSAAALLEATPQAAASPTPLRRLGSSLPPQPGATPPRGVAAVRSSPPSQGPHLGGSNVPSGASSAPRGGAPLPLASSARSSAPPVPQLPPASSPPRPKSVPVPLSALESGRFAAHDFLEPSRVSEGRVRLATQPDAEQLTSPGVARFDDQTFDHFNSPQPDPSDPSERRTNVTHESEEPWAPPPPSSRPPSPPPVRAQMATSENTAQMPALTELNAIEVLRGRRPLKALVSSASDWDAVPTKTLSGADLSNLDRSRAPVVIESETSTKGEPNAPASQPPPSVRTNDRQTDDRRTDDRRTDDRRTDDRRAPPLATSQAVRVVLWKDANGVHVAPQGTRVSAITVDVMVVALDPSADIRAWLDPEHRKGSQ